MDMALNYIRVDDFIAETLEREAAHLPPSAADKKHTCWNGLGDCAVLQAGKLFVYGKTYQTTSPVDSK
jgi:hypothetical protein